MPFSSDGQYFYGDDQTVGGLPSTGTKSVLIGQTFPPNTMQTYQIYYNRRYNISVRLRPTGDMSARPVYATVTIYPCLIKATGDEDVFVGFGPHTKDWLGKSTENSFDIYIPTTDPAVVLYGGELTRLETPTDWPWDIRASQDLKDLLFGRPIEELKGGALPVEDPFSSVSKPELAAFYWFDKPSQVVKGGRALPTAPGKPILSPAPVAPQRVEQGWVETISEGD